MVTSSLSLWVMSWVMLAPWLPDVVDRLLEHCDDIPELQAPAERRDAPPALPGKRVALSSNLSWVLPADWLMERVPDEAVKGKLEYQRWWINGLDKPLVLSVYAYRPSSVGRSEPGLRQWLEHYVADVDAWLAAFKTDLAFFDYVQTLTPAAVREAPVGQRGLTFRLLWSVRHRSSVRTVRLSGAEWVFYAEVRTFESREGVRRSSLVFKAFDETGMERSAGTITSDQPVDHEVLWMVVEQLAASASSKPPAE